VTQTQALLLTLAIEGPVAVAFVAWRRWAPGRLGIVAVASVAASLLTHPLLWLVDPLLHSSLDTPARWALLETSIALVEAGVYAVGAGLATGRALWTSVIANAASFGAGLVIYLLD
jgi:hypothetical protein